MTRTERYIAASVVMGVLGVLCAGTGTYLVAAHGQETGLVLTFAGVSVTLWGLARTMLVGGVHDD